MDDDLNTAEAIGMIFEYVHDINLAFEDGKGAKSAKEALEALDKVLGVLGLAPEDEQIPSEILALAEQRQQARQARDFAKSDALRDQLAGLGYELKDTPDGVKISKR
jgi:cysteinyl-tRNA synthetase